LKKSAVELVNPSPTLRMRRQTLPEGELLTVINAGAGITAELAVEAGHHLTLLTVDGETPVDVHTGKAAVHIPAQAAVVIKSSRWEVVGRRK